MKTNQPTTNLNLKKKYNKTAYYIILIVTLHWSFISPAQVIFEAYFEINDINKESLLGLLRNDEKKQIKRAYDTGFESTGASGPALENRLWEEKEPVDPETSGNLNPIKAKQNVHKKSKTEDVGPKRAEKRLFTADMEEGVIGVSKAIPFDSPSDNLFKINIEKLPEQDESAFLVYELYGVQDHSAVSRSINDRLSVGGYAVKRNTEWTLQKEEINPEWLMEGENKILFTTPPGADHQYTIRNLRIETWVNKVGEIRPQLIVHHDLLNLGREGNVYVKGYVSGPVNGELKVISGDTPLRLTSSNEFEGFVKVKEIAGKKQVVAIKAVDDTGLLGQEILMLDALHEADRVYPLEFTTHSSSKYFPAFKDTKLDIPGASIKVVDSALVENKEISITQLRKIDIAPMESGMYNVTKGEYAYRFLPDGTSFEKPVKISIAYDSLLIPKGYSPSDIRTFYFDTQRKKWMVLPKESVDVNNGVITSLTTHFTDYVNGIIQSPESPETGTFLPTMMNDLQAANPSAGITIINPPQASQKGGAELGYPIKIPAGRNGMQPQLAIQYNNEGGNGWLGLGWNLNVPAVTLDTRWGVPLFDDHNETEIYTIAGEQLMYPEDYLPHRHEGDIPENFSTELQNRGAHTTGNIKTFTPRKQGSFVKIERIGNNTAQYRWKVTNTNGTVSWYGGDASEVNENTVIRDLDGNIVHWGLWMTEDVFGNNIKYTYTNTNLGALSGQYENLSNGKVFYLNKISYTGYNGNEGNYTVEFGTSTSIKTDVTINGRLGLKQVDPYLLEHIHVKYQNEMIRSYELGYTNGRFNKTLLSTISEKDKNDNVFYSHEFEYYDDIVNNALYKPVEVIDLPNIGANFAIGAFANPIDKSPISTTENIESGYHAGVSAGLDIFPFTWTQYKKNIFTVTAPLGENSYKSKGKIAFIDIDGDGIDDIVYRTSNGLKYIPGGLEEGTNGDFFINYFDDSNIKNINNISDFAKSKGFSKTMFGESYELNVLNFQASTKRIKSKTETGTFLIDANNDGLIDLVHNKVVYFNTIDEYGEPAFKAGSEFSENMLITAQTIAPWTDPNEEPIPPVDDQTVLDFDAVRVWIAPRDGEIEIQDRGLFGFSTYSIETSNSSIGNGSPFRIYSQALNGSAQIELTSYENGAPLGLNAQNISNPYPNQIIVEKGQKIYFRVHNEPENGNIEVKAYPIVHYTDAIEYQDENSNPTSHFEYARIFFVSGEGLLGIPGTGNVSISWPNFPISPRDDVVFRIYQIEYDHSSSAEPIETLIYKRTCPQGQSTSVTVADNELLYDLTNLNYGNEDISVGLRFEAYSDSNGGFISSNNGDWHPVVNYTSTQNDIDDRVEYPVPDYSIYRATSFTPEYFYTLDAANWTNPTLPGGYQEIGAKPATQIVNTGIFLPEDQGEFILVVKDEAGWVIGKKKLQVENQVIIPEDNNPIEIFSGVLSTSGPVKYNIGYYAIGNQNSSVLQKYIEAVGEDDSVLLSYNFSIQNSTIKVPALEYYRNLQHLGPLNYHWGQFFYNENYDPSNIVSDNIGKLINNSIVENPTLGMSFIDSDCDQTVPEEDYVDCVIGNLNLPGESTDFSQGSNLEDLFDNLDGWLDDNNFTIPEINFLPAKPYRTPQNNYWWVGLSPNQYSRVNSIKTDNMGAGGGGSGVGGDTGPFSGIIEETDTEVTYEPMNEDTGMYAVDKVHKSSTRTYAAGYGSTIFNDSETSYSNTVQDFMDINGDGYPDVVYTDRQVLTSMTGGHLPHNAHSVGSAAEFTNKNFGLSLSSSTMDSRMKEAMAFAKSLGGMDNTTFDVGPPSNRIGLNLNLNGENKEDSFLIDLNGDGLLDRVEKINGNYVFQLNKGSLLTSSSSFENFPFVHGNVTKPSFMNLNFGTGFGFNIGNSGIYANFNAGHSGSQSTSVIAFQDLNGDGLVDMIITDNNGLGKVRFNTGVGFGPEENLTAGFISPNLKDNNRSRSVSVSGDGSYYYGFTICCGFVPVFHLKFGANAGGSLSLTISDNKKTFKDINGDGYADFITYNSSNDKLNVYYSAIGRTNMLKTVNNPLGGSFTMDYTPNKKTYNNPNAKWVMSDLYVDDGYDLANDGEDIYHQRFVYENAKYDRREREFYGFEKVKTIEYIENGTIDPPTLEPYRTSVSIYHNNSYFLNGLLKESYVVKGGDGASVIGDPASSTLFSRTLNTYTLYGLQENNTEIDLSNVLPEDYDVGGTEGRGTAAVFLTETENRLHDLSSNPLITRTSLEYDELGRVVRFIHHGDVSTPSDNYTSEISYHNDAALMDLNIRSVPEEIMVMVGTNVVRKRSTANIDLATGTIGTILAEIDAQNNAVTSLEYDQYGNLTKITYPENEDNEAMFYEYAYDTIENKYTIGIEDAFGYASSSQYDYRFDTLLQTEDMAGNKMNYEYDDFGRITKIIAPKEQNGLINDYTVKYAYYTKYGQLSGVANINEQDFMPVAVTSHFDVQHPGNDIETFTFIDGLSRPVQIKKDIAMPFGFQLPTPVLERMSVSGKTAFDRFGRAVKQYHPWHEEKDPDLNYRINNTVNIQNSHHSTTQYDEINRPVKTIDPEGNEAVMEYALDGGLHKTTTIVDQNSQNQIITKTFKDALGRVVETLNVGGAGDISTVFEYNPIGELLSYTDDEGLTTSYTYDNLGRKTEVNHPDSGRTKYFYDNASNLIQLQTEKLIQAQEYIDYVYDHNRLTDIIFPGTNNISNVTYEYGGPTDGNNAGRLIAQTDATGEQEFEYGNMGELIYTKRTVVGPNIPTRSFETHFDFDSWNRLLGMTYPDGEEVGYTYDLGGNLTKMSGEVNNQPYDYIAEIRYDHFEMPIYREYGNGTKTNYTYTPQLRRLNTLTVKAANNQNMFNNSYSYDKVGNITGISNNATPHNGNYMGGIYQHNYEYDVLNRLSQATGSFNGNGFFHPEFKSSYSLRMNYNSTHGITRKRQTHNKNNTVFAENTYVNDYTYHQGTHRVASILNASNVEETFAYDDNGNMTNRQINKQDQTSYYWDESNRLRVVDDQLMMHHYIYDAGGQRVLKSSSDPTQVFENGTPVNPASVQFDNYLTYPSSFLVIKGNGEYSKHYFNGAQRVVARIGEEDDDYFDLGEPGFKWEELKQLQIQDLQAIAAKTKRGAVSFKSMPDTGYKEEHREMEHAPSHTEQSGSDERAGGGLYFYHPDHLGTGTFLTDANGLPYQFFLNLPFGETMIEQHSLTEDYENLWKFTGHELDKQTGLYYAGARFYDPKASIWLSVDPLVEQTMDAYGYSYNNPIRFIDPTGLAPEDIIIRGRNGNTITIPTADDDHRYVDIPFDIDESYCLDLGLSNVNTNNLAVGYSIGASAEASAVYGGKISGNITVVNFPTNSEYGDYNYVYASGELGGSGGVQKSASLNVEANFFIAYSNDRENIKPSYFEGRASTYGLSFDAKAIAGGGFSIYGFQSQDKSWTGVGVGFNLGAGYGATIGAWTRGESNSIMLNNQIPTGDRSRFDRFINNFGGKPMVYQALYQYLEKNINN